MPSYRLFPTLGIALLFTVGALAQAPAPSAPQAGGPPTAPATPPAPPTPAESTIDEAIKKIAKITSVSAVLEQTVEMLGQTFSVQGQYLRAPDNKIKLFLILKGLGDAKGRMQQVCDGTVLWDFTQVLDSQSCRKLSIGPVMKRLSDPACDVNMRDKILSSLGFAGPDALLAGLRSACAFNQRDAGELDGKKIWILRGEWKDRAAVGGPPPQQMGMLSPLPPYVPSIVELWIGQEDGWPYRVQLAGKPMLGPYKMQQQIGPDGRPIGAKIPIQKEKPSKIVLVYSKVNLAPKLSADDFAFQPPPGVNVVDGTQPLTAELDNILADASAKKKAEANAASGAVLDQSIPVPRTPPDTPSAGSSRGVAPSTAPKP
jgi:outer membrane lipoprotein-sorting protein